jgi:hypothetical protein
MLRSITRLAVIAAVLSLALTQVGAYLDLCPKGGDCPGCAVCAFVAWAILPVRAAFRIALAFQPLEKSSFPLAPGLERTESRTPRAPPSV